MYQPQFLTEQQKVTIRQHVGAPDGVPVAVYSGGGWPAHYDQEQGKVCVNYGTVCRLLGKPEQGKTWASK